MLFLSLVFLLGLTACNSNQTAEVEVSKEQLAEEKKAAEEQAKKEKEEAASAARKKKRAEARAKERAQQKALEEARAKESQTVTTPPPTRSTTTTTSSASMPAISSAFKSSMIQKINAQRAKGCSCGGEKFPPAPPIQWNSKLGSAAMKHSMYMSGKDKMSHTGSGGSDVGRRAKAEGYNYRFAGENLAKGPNDIGTVVGLWVKSPTHCKNLMSKNFSQAGAAKHKAYWTLVLGTPM